LALPQEAWIVLFAANSIRENRWKDFETLRAAVRHIAAQEKRKPVRFVAVGEGGASDKAGLADVHFLPFERNPLTMARYYQAADVYVHAARVDTFPNTVMEATACGTPVVATAVGGIPEQVLDGQSGFLVPAGDAEAMARQARWLLEDDERRRVISAQAVRIAKARFDLNRQVQAYLTWYEHLTIPSRGTSEIAHAC
jgi:glycosyltransferase involved in cell wall biosynthesis